MHCEQARLQLQQNDGRSEQEYSDALFGHLSDCSDCWSFATALWEDEQVHNAAYEPGPADIDRMLDRAWRARQQQQPDPATGGLRILATAAMILAVVGVAFMYTGRPDAPRRDPAQIVMDSTVTRQVDFLLTSAQALGEATITLELDENLALDGYPGMKRISWLTSIKAGDNRLTLPLRLQDDNDGVITFAIESDGRRKQMMFTVQPSDRGANTQVI